MEGGDAINMNRVLTIGDTVAMEVLFHIQTPQNSLNFWSGTGTANQLINYIHVSPMF